MKLSGKILLLACLAVLLAGAFFIWKPSVGSMNPGNSGAVFGSGLGPGKSADGLGTVARQDLAQRVTIAGSVVPIRKTVVTAPYNGYVKKVFVKIGDQVKVGDPLVSVVQSLQSNDDSFPLRSPLAGTVVQIEKAEGEYVHETDPKEFILRVDDLSHLFVMANAPEIDRIKLKKGQEAVIKASAVLTRKYKGIIRELALAAREKDAWSRSQVVDFPVRIEMMDNDAVIEPGMSVVIDVITAKKEQVLMVRHEFIHRDGEKYFVIMSDGKRRDIQVGLQNEDGFEIISGLNEGEKMRQVDFSELAGES